MIDWLKRHPHRSALLFLSLLPMALLWPSLLGGNTFLPWDLAQFPPAATKLTDAEYQQTIHEHNTDVTEVPVMFAPQLEFIRSELHQGRIAHWDPYSRSGTPMWASSILGIAYPLNWPLFLGHSWLDHKKCRPKRHANQGFQNRLDIYHRYLPIMQQIPV